MWILMVLVGVFFLSLFAYNYYINRLLKDYTLNKKINVFSGVKLTSKPFIGMHMQTFGTISHLVYARLTTPYLGIILFIPESNFDFTFYLPLLFKLARNGYIIVSYNSKRDIISQGLDEVSQVISDIKNEEALKDYQIQTLAHGEGCYLALKLDYPSYNLSMPKNQEDELLDYLEENKLKSFTNYLVKQAKKFYNTSLFKEIKQEDISHDYKIVQSTLDEQLELENVEYINYKSHHLYLKEVCEHKLEQLSDYLKSPQIGQWDFNKAIEDFDISTINQVDEAILNDMLAFYNSHLEKKEINPRNHKKENEVEEVKEQVEDKVEEKMQEHTENKEKTKTEDQKENAD